MVLEVGFEPTNSLTRLVLQTSCFNHSHILAYGTQERTRTDTDLRPKDFKSPMSTISTTWANKDEIIKTILSSLIFII